MRIRSPRIAPPVNGEFGSVARTATELPFFRSRATTPSTSVDLPVPGAPVKPTTPGARRSFRRDSSRVRTEGSRRSTMLIALARARTSPVRNRLAKSESLSSLPTQEVQGEVVTQHHDEAVGLLAGGGRRAGGCHRHNRGAEEALHPLGVQGELAIGVVESSPGELLEPLTN